MLGCVTTTHHCRMVPEGGDHTTYTFARYLVAVSLDTHIHIYLFLFPWFFWKQTLRSKFT